MMKIWKMLLTLKQFEERQNKPTHILGDYTMFSGMTDWNQAEIVKLTFKSCSNRHLITEDVWAKHV